MSILLGYHASHEQFPPSRLLELVKMAERAGFRAAMTSDHIAPWSERQGHSGNNWAWLGAALAQTSLSFGSLAIPGGWRYHPAVLAHLIATLAEMFPDRLRWIAVGSGEAVNEIVVGKGWPEKAERHERLRAGADILRSLMSGGSVSADHSGFAMEDVRLWSLPSRAPLLLGAALTKDTAGWLGSWADGLVTVPKPKAELAELIGAFRKNGGEGKPLALQLQVSLASTREEARLAAWERWRNAAARPDQLADLRRPEDFDEATRDVRPQEMDDIISLVTSGEEILEIVRDYASCGFDEIYIHNVSEDQEGFIRAMGKDVLPHFQ